MNWDAIGAIGELLSAAAVVVTLVYLAAQIRQNNVAMRVAAKQEITRQFSDYTDLLLQNPDLHEINIRGQAGEDLQGLERGRFFILLQKATWYFASMHFQHEVQSLSEEEWRQSRELIRRYCDYPGYRTWWIENRRNYAPSFVSFIESHWHER